MELKLFTTTFENRVRHTEESTILFADDNGREEQLINLYPQVKCVGIDGEVEVLRDIKAGGSVLCTVISDLDGANAEVCELAEKLMAGKSVQKYTSVPYDIVTIENVDVFLAKAEEEAAKYAE